LPKSFILPIFPKSCGDGQAFGARVQVVDTFQGVRVLEGDLAAAFGPTTACGRLRERVLRWAFLRRECGLPRDARRRKETRMTEDDFEVELEDLAIDEIRELLFQAGAELTLEQAEQLARFVHQAGGLQAALETLQQLLDRREAA
jgi:hypothetical protein